MDIFWDQGGSYVINPVTGERELVQRTLAQEEVVIPIVDLATPAQPSEE